MNTLKKSFAAQVAILLALVVLVPAGLLAQNAVPLVSQPLVPDAAAPGGAAFVLTVNGSGFLSSSVVNWNGAALTTTFVSASQLTAAVPATNIATAGTASVTVTSPAPGGGTSNPVAFSVAKATTGAFFTRVDQTINATAQSAVAADFRNIGKTDLVVANSANSIDVFLSNGDGTFAAPVNYPFTSGFPVAVIAADFNGDGKKDLAVVLEHIHMVAILLGNGDGTFTMGQQFGTGGNPDAIAAADLNNDGKLDLVTTNFSDNTVSVLLGNGDGTFQLQHPYGTGVKPVSVAVGDFNRDGLLDLAVANNSDGTVSILLGAGNGTFAAHVDYATAGLPTDVKVADFNKDGKLDLALSTAANSASVLLGNGDGTFAAQATYAIGANSQGLEAADVNGDGNIDLITANLAANSISVLLGTGTGTFKAQEVFATNTAPVAVLAADFNRDGLPDLATIDGGQLSVFTQTLLSVNPTILSFPKTISGYSAAPLTATIRNSGTTTVTLGAATLAGANPGDYSYTTTCAAVAPGKTCTYTVTFTPQDMGTRTALISIPLSNGSLIGVELTGTSNILVAIEPNPHTFPTTLVGSSSLPFKATFVNKSKVTVNLTSLLVTGLDPSEFPITTNNCSSNVVPPLGSCTVFVTFKPVAVGNRTAALTVFGHFSPGNGQQAILMNGIGTNVKVTPTTLPFAAQTVGTTSAAQTVTFKSVATVAMPLTVSIQGTNFKDFAITNNCPNPVPANSSCTVLVTFTPTATGARTATLNFGDPDPTGPQVVTLNGTGQ